MGISKSSVANTPSLAPASGSDAVVPQHTQAAKQSGWSSPPWWVGFLLAMAVFVPMTFLTLTRSPLIGWDEYMLADAGVRYVLGHGFTSATWMNQGTDELYVAGAPLLPFLGIPWYYVFGVSCFSIRAFPTTLAILSAFFIAHASHRFGWVRNGWVIAFMVFALLGADGVALSYRFARYDMLGLLFASMIFWAFTLSDRRLRYAVIVPAALLIGPGGFGHPAGLLALLLLAQLVFRGRFVLESIVAVAASGLGVALLLGYWWTQGLYDRAVEAAMLARSSYFGDISVPERIVWSLYNDLGSLVILVGLLPVILVAMLTPAVRTVLLNPLLLALASVTLVPAFVCFFGRVPPYYSWLEVAPATVFIGACLQRLLEPANASLPRRRLIATSLFSVLLVCSVGAVYRSTLAITEWNMRDIEPLQAFVASQLKPDDVIYTVPPPYYVLAKSGHEAYYELSKQFTPEGAARVTLVFCRANELEANARDRLHSTPAAWREVARYDAPKPSFRIPLLPKGQPYQIVAYRRAEATSASTQPATLPVSPSTQPN